jgi:hypothetical protein
MTVSYLGSCPDQPRSPIVFLVIVASAFARFGIHIIAGVVADELLWIAAPDAVVGA